MRFFLLILTFLTSMTFAQTKLTVSGISSGAYMAQQLHTAFSSKIEGAGMIAGGPFWCAQGKVLDALNRCMKTTLGNPDPKVSVAQAKRLFTAQLIDNPSYLASSRVYILSGTKDEIILSGVVESLVETYKLWGTKNIRFENKLMVGHAFATLDYGNPCATAADPPFISHCSRDIAGEILTYLLGHLEPRKPQNPARLFTFDQLQNIDTAEAETLSMGQKGYAYVPEGCEDPQVSGCRIHIAFHGCKQALEDVQTAFVTKIGYNEWAQANRIVIVYPQVVKNLLTNPNACWDWWGYSGADYHTKKGPQMRHVMKLVEELQRGVLRLKKLNIRNEQHTQ